MKPSVAIARQTQAFEAVAQQCARLEALVIALCKLNGIDPDAVISGESVPVETDLIPLADSELAEFVETETEASDAPESTSVGKGKRKK